MDATNPLFGLLTIAVGIGVSFAVSGLKKIPFVKNNPKITGLIFAAIIQMVGSLTGVLPADAVSIIAGGLGTVASAVTTYEVVTKPVAAQAEEDKTIGEAERMPGEPVPSDPDAEARFQEEARRRGYVGPL